MRCSRFIQFNLAARAAAAAAAIRSAMKPPPHWMVEQPSELMMTFPHPPLGAPNEVRGQLAASSTGGGSGSAGRGPVREIFFRALAALTLLWLLAAATAPAATLTNEAQDNGRQVKTGSCRPDEEFECQIDGRCIPLEWRCDFTEQCADGQDERNCLPERCDFDRDLCNWLNQFDSDQQHPQLERLEPAAASEPRTGASQQTVWRRFFRSAATARQKQPGISHSSQSAEWETLQGAMLRQLERLASKRRAQVGGAPDKGKYLFVPLLLAATPPFPNDNSTMTATDEAAPRRGAKISGLKSARLSSPLISQTNSMCQLRFKYSLWKQSRPATGGHEEASQGSSLALGLWARDRPSGKRRLLWFANARPQEESQWSLAPQGGSWLREVVELGHQKAIELYFQAELSALTEEASDFRPPSSRDDDDDDGTARSEETKQPSANNTAGAAAAVVDSSDSSSSFGSKEIKRGAGRKQPRREVGFAAISWIEFRHCGWPQGAVLAGQPLVSASSYGEEDNNYEDADDEFDLELKPSQQQGHSNLTDDYFWAETGPAAAAPDKPPTRPPAAEQPICPTDGGYFLCPSGGRLQLCIDSRKVCNFVDDCMSSAALYSGPNEISSSDESPSGVCKNVPGMEDFEPMGSDAGVPLPRLQVILQQQQHLVRSGTRSQGHKSVGSSRPFWSLGGNWPADKIKLQWAPINNESLAAEAEAGAKAPAAANQAAHLPRKDHTPNRKGRGHYLALEIPKPAPPPAARALQSGSSSRTDGTRRPPDERAHWIYLESPWLKRGPRRIQTHQEDATNSSANESSDGFNAGDHDCRVKFFYNLVSRQGHHTEPAVLAPTLPSNLYLMVEHVVMPSDTSTAAIPQPKLDSLTYLSRPQLLVNDDRYHYNDDGGDQIGQGRHAGSIDWPGADFWREFNHALRGLQESDVFYIRITLMVEHADDGKDETDLTRNMTDASFSFDDLSTHPGCSSGAHEALLADPAFQRRAQQFRLDGRRLAPTLENIIRLRQQQQQQQPDTSNKQQGAGSDTSVPKMRRKYLYNALQFEPHRLILYVLVCLMAMFGLIFIIVFIVVPHVERAVIDFHDQLLLSVNDEMDDTPRNSMAVIGSSAREHLYQQEHRYRHRRRVSLSLDGGLSRLSAAGLEACELTDNGSDWDHLATSGGRWRYPRSPGGGGGPAGASVAAARPAATGSNSARRLHYNESDLTTCDSVATILDSDSYSQRLSSVGESFVILRENGASGRGSGSSNPESNGGGHQSGGQATNSSTSGCCTSDDGDESTFICDRNSDDPTT